MQTENEFVSPLREMKELNDVVSADMFKVISSLPAQMLRYQINQLQAMIRVTEKHADILQSRAKALTEVRADPTDLVVLSKISEAILDDMRFNKKACDEYQKAVDACLTALADQGETP